MEQINTKIRKWGNSLGIVLPKSLVENQELKEGIDICVSIGSKRKTVRDLMEFSKKNKLKKVDIKKSFEEIDKELWN